MPGPGSGTCAEPLRKRQVHLDDVPPAARRYAIRVKQTGKGLSQPVFRKPNALSRAAEPRYHGRFHQPLKVNRRIVF